MKYVTRIICVVMVILLVLGACAVGISVASAASVISTYSQSFENGYPSTATGVSVVDDNGTKVLEQRISSNEQNYYLGIYNSENKPLTLSDGKVYAVRVTYKVVRIGGEDADLSTTVTLVRNTASGGELVKVKSFPDAVYRVGDTTDWVTSTVVFKASIASSPEYNYIGINVLSQSCPESNTVLDEKTTVIRFKEITVTECNENTKAIELQANGGSHCDAVLAQAGESITLPTPTRDLYEFKGWYTDAGFKTKFNGSTMPSALSTKLYAKWEVTDEAVTVRFQTNGAEAVNDKVGRKGDAVVLPKISREGFFFSGWYDKDYKTKYSFTEIPEEDITLYAKWESIPRVVDFENKSVFPTPNNSSFTMRCVIEESGKAFKGTSFLHYSFQRGVEIGQSTNPRGVAGVILYDKNGQLITVKDNTKYAVSFNYFVESNTTEGRIAMISASKGGAWYDRQSQEDWCVLNYGPEDVGKGWQKHTFLLDWKVENDDGTAAYIGIAGDGVVYIDNIEIYEIPEGAGLDTAKSTICLDSGYDAIGDTIYAENGSQITLPTLEREGYRFLGWTYDEDRTESVENNVLTVEGMFTMLYADWFKLPETTLTPEETQNEPSESIGNDTDNTDNGNGELVLYIVIAAVALAVIAVVVVIIVKKRKKA